MENITEQEWTSYFMLLNEEQKKSVVLMLKVFLLGRSKESQRISIEQYNKEIEEAIAEIEAGQYNSHAELKK
ncbi:MAG: hypothetical protein RIR12_1586 [Bacteroidota bacterium]|jgi:hypothetical protein